MSELMLVLLLAIHVPPRLMLQHQLDNLKDEQNHILSVAVWCCWADEDFVGRVSRVTRRGHPNTVPLRTLQKVLILYRRQWRTHGWI